MHATRPRHTDFHRPLDAVDAGTSLAAVRPLRGLARRRLLLGGLALTAVAGSGCALMAAPATGKPIGVLRAAGPCVGMAPALVVMLPGAYSRPPEFVEEGFVEAMRLAGAAADVLIADAHIGYFTERSVLTRLREDIVLPARAQGYRQIWLVGISLGGFAALGYATRHGAEIDGVVALAPYLGPRRLLQEIAEAGGPAAWRAAGPALGSDELERELWAWLTGPPPLPPALPPLPVYLGYGADDRFADAHRTLAGLLPAERVSTAPGGHDWAAWRALWRAWLARGLLPSGCGSA